MTDRELWMIVRRALFMVISACDKRYGVVTDRAAESSAR